MRSMGEQRGRGRRCIQSSERVKRGGVVRAKGTLWNWGRGNSTGQKEGLGESHFK